MLKLIQALGRLSIRGYLLLTGFVVIALLATYSNIQSQLEIASQAARDKAAEQVKAEQIRQKEANTEQQSASQPETLGASDTNEGRAADPAAGTLPPTSNATAVARKAGNLVFSPSTITLSLSHKMPLVTVSSPDGNAISQPILAEETSGLELNAVVTTTDTNMPTWHIRLSGNVATGVYKLPLTSSSVDNTKTYTGTLTVVVVL